jgi:glucan phosphorylase
LPKNSCWVWAGGAFCGPREEVPIGHVTNGIHVPSWDSETADELRTTSCGKERWLGEMDTVEKDIRQVPDEQLWTMRQTSRGMLVEHARARYSRRLIASGASPDEIAQAKQILDPDVLIPGFARRFAAYKQLVGGVDVWINTPRRPREACGTSGMKVLVNGGLNISELDGWWAEAHEPEVGWSLGDGREHGDDPAWDTQEAQELYERLENEVIPAFYTRNANGIPTAWLAKMRESMARLTLHFSANRAVRQYTEKYYLPAMTGFEARRGNKGALGIRMVNWRRQIEQGWRSISFGGLQMKTRDGQHHFKVEVNLAGVDPEAVRVELFAEEPEGPVETNCRTEREVMCLPLKCRQQDRRAILPRVSFLTFPVLACRLKYP